jgi:glycerol-3-phosphate dehydrogenase (NAD(P)+)
VLGAGSFGTCLAIQLAEKQCDVHLWSRDAAVADAINKHRRNPRYLSEFWLPPSIFASVSLAECLRDREVVVSVVPSHAVREVWQDAATDVHPHALLLSVSKGIEIGTGLLVHQILEQVLPPATHARVVSLSGPSFAREIAQRLPTAVTVAARQPAFAIAAQELLSSPVLRCYTSDDIVGVELGGALKNVIAIAVGISDGMALGHNARAALITRGLAEMTRLGRALGADPLTFQGLSGIGDLVLTCTGDLSRNRRVGLQIGRGRPVEEVLGQMTEVAEGVRTARSAHELALARGVDMPISRGVYQILYQGKSTAAAFEELVGRPLKSEREER